MATKKQQELFLFRIRLACKIARQKGALFNEEILIAQAAHESGWGTSQLAARYNNILGIKAGSNWNGDVVVLPTWELVNGKKVNTVARWRRYLSWNLCIVDYSNLLQTLPWYKNSLNYLNDPDDFLREILPGPKSLQFPNGKPGWATDINYKKHINDIREVIKTM